ncbi:MAG: hypothetical protein QNJ40_12730 [Xanthomonadales bacterium]|nr:hypothetical protein [Xanthomonadales bacterium]
MHFEIRALISVLAALLAASCAANGPNRSYPPGSIGASLKAQSGTVMAVETVIVEGNHSVVGTLGGAAVGNSLGRTVGGGSGRRVAGAVGAVAGAVAGRAAEKHWTRQTAAEVTVKLDNGGVIAVIQDMDASLSPGDRVRVLRGRRTSQVIAI